MPVSLAAFAGALHLSFPSDPTLAALLFLPLADSCCQNCPAGSTKILGCPPEPPLPLFGPSLPGLAGKLILAVSGKGVGSEFCAPITATTSAMRLEETR